jgi:hypothetical protein
LLGPKIALEIFTKRHNENVILPALVYAASHEQNEYLAIFGENWPA